MFRELSGHVLILLYLLSEVPSSLESVYTALLDKVFSNLITRCYLIAFHTLYPITRKGLTLPISCATIITDRKPKRFGFEKRRI